MNLLSFKKKKIHLYKGCQDLSIKNFDIIYRTKDLRYLIVGFDGYKDVKVPESANERWKEIYDEWIKLIDNNTITYYYQLILEVTYLQTRYDVSKMLLFQIYNQESMSESDLDKYIDSLSRWDYYFDKKKDKLDEIQRLMNQNKASENKLNLKKSELEEMANENTEEEKTLEGQAVILEQITGKNNIDVEKTSVAKWIEIGKLATQINEQRRKK